MKYKRIACFSIALLIIAVGWLSVFNENARAASDAIGTAVCTARSYVNLRGGPSTGYKKTGRLPAKASVSVYQQSGKWYKIFYNNTFHWVYASYLRVTLNGGGTSGQPTSNPPSLDTNTIGTAVCTAKSSINLRSGPSTRYKITGRLLAKSVVTVYEKSGSWYRIAYNGAYHWASASYLKMNSSAAVTTPVSDGNSIGTAICTAKSSINLRSGPGTSYKKTGTLPAKAAVDVFQQSGSWYRISYKGAYHWATASYLKVTLNNTPVTTPTQPVSTPAPVLDPYAEFPYAANQRLSGKIVVVDPGHGQGAGGFYKEYQEYVYTLKFANLLKQDLENSGATVVLTRSAAGDVYNYSRMAMLNRYGLTLVQNARQSEYDANGQKITDLQRQIADMEAAAAKTMQTAEVTPTPSATQNGGEANALEEAESPEPSATPEDPALTAAKAQLAELVKQNEVLNTTIEDIKSLEGIMKSVEENTALAQTYFLCPYDAVNGRAIHNDLKRIFEYLKDPVVQNKMIFVSLHTNATGDGSTSAKGTVTYYMDNAINTAYYTGYPADKNKKLAQVLLDNTVAAVDFTKRGCVANDFFMVRETTVPAALIEIGFHTNTEDREKLISETYEKRIANGILFGIFANFGL